MNDTNAVSNAVSLDRGPLLASAICFLNRGDKKHTLLLGSQPQQKEYYRTAFV